jgi:hypothetical protein
MPTVEQLDTRVAVVPTDAPESDGTLAWDSTTIVLVKAHGGGESSLGWTYGNAAVAGVVEGTLPGCYRDAVPIHGSSGFTSYSDEQLTDRLGGWAAQGIKRVRMKVGREAEADPHRLEVARAAIGPESSSSSTPTARAPRTRRSRGPSATGILFLLAPRSREDHEFYGSRDEI